MRENLATLSTNVVAWVGLHHTIQTFLSEKGEDRLNARDLLPRNTEKNTEEEEKKKKRTVEDVVARVELGQTADGPVGGETTGGGRTHRDLPHFYPLPPQSETAFLSGFFIR